MEDRAIERCVGKGGGEVGDVFCAGDDRVGDRRFLIMVTGSGHLRMRNDGRNGKGHQKEGEGKIRRDKWKGRGSS